MRGLGEPRRTAYGPVRKEGRRQDTQTLQSQNPLGLVAGGGGTRQNRWGSELPAWKEVEKVEWHLPLRSCGPGCCLPARSHVPLIPPWSVLIPEFNV